MLSHRLRLGPDSFRRIYSAGKGHGGPGKTGSTRRWRGSRLRMSCDGEKEAGVCEGPEGRPWRPAGRLRRPGDRSGFPDQRRHPGGETGIFERGGRSDGSEQRGREAFGYKTQAADYRLAASYAKYKSREEAQDDSDRRFAGTTTFSPAGRSPDLPNRPRQRDNKGL